MEQVPTRDDSDTIENRYYRVTVDRKRGTLRSIWDKELGRELVDADAPYGFNEYIHADVTEGYEGEGGYKKAGIAHDEGVRYTPDAIGPLVRRVGSVSSSVRVDARVTRGPAPATIVRTVALHDGIKLIDIVNEVDRPPSLRKEQIYFAFPGASAGRPIVQLELPYAVLRWDTDILPGCWRGYSSAQYWLDASTEEYGLTLSSLDAPVVCMGGITSNEWDPDWHASYMPDNAHVYSYIMSNIWNCNYFLWQGGRTQFADRLTTHAGPCDRAAAARFGWGNAAPLLATAVGPQRGAWPEAGISLLTVNRENVLIPVVKRADDGDGWIVCLYETGGHAQTEVRVIVGFVAIHSAERDTLAEEHIADLPLDRNTIMVSLAAHELAMLRIR